MNLTESTKDYQNETKFHIISGEESKLPNYLKIQLDCHQKEYEGYKNQIYNDYIISYYKDSSFKERKQLSQSNSTQSVMWLNKEQIKGEFYLSVDCYLPNCEFTLKIIFKENIELIKEYLGIEKLISPSQTHSTNIDIANFEKENYPETDALILTDKRIGIFLNFADCTPIILYDKVKNIGAIAHGGWRGTAGNISGQTVKLMKDKFNCNPSDISALIGPCISKCCFEVKENVYKKLYQPLDLDITPNSNGKFFADLKEINKIQLQNEGIKNIDICPYCTVCNNDKFFSYRKENGTTCRHSAVLKLK